MTKFYPETAASPDFPKLEQEVLESWKAGGTFKKSVTRGQESESALSSPKASGSLQNQEILQEQSKEYVFYDGPPFANGLPHYGHLLTGFVKDIFARYHTMKGSKVERRFGWDCHGLPAEMAAEKELGVSGRANIEKFGIQKFNDHCRTSVMRYAKDWEQYVTRQARWVDFENDYKTMNKDYMESVMWAFKTLYDKGLIYESHRVMPYSWAMETPVSNFETRMDNAYREREDRAVYVAFKLNEIPAKIRDHFSLYNQEIENAFIVAWTTTPWTLPSNLGLAVNPSFRYVAVRQENSCYVLSIEAAIKLFPDVVGKAYQRTAQEDRPLNERSDQEFHQNQYTFKGSELKDASYEPLFPYFNDEERKKQNAFRVLDGSSFIEEGSGTGVVHLAPGFGEDDQRVCAENGIEIVCPVDSAGKYTDEIFDILSSPLAGEHDALLRVGGGTREGTTLFAKEKAKELRKEMTDAEKKLWYCINDEKLGYKIRRQQPIGNYIADFYNSEKRLVIEVDGGGHADKTEHDAERTAYLNEQGIHVLRFWNNEVLQNIDGVVQRIVEALEKSPHAVSNETAAPPQGGSQVLSLKGLNVVADVRKNADEPYTDSQLSKYGLVNLRIIAWLKLHGQLIKQEDIKHNYPHCWRTDTPLIYRALPSWYVEVTKFNQRMVELNQQINWIPEHIKDGRFGKWLEGARDWSISRNRYWGSPIPVWKNEKGDVKVFGSIAELESFFGVKVEDLHRPFIDSLTKDGWTRVTDVFDCWFESGSMPFAQVHYPFENKDWFETHFPADFIVEYEAQTRGWFYTLMVLATALFDKPPFKNVICHGVVLDEKGQKLSKRLNNYADPLALMDQYGADALRWRMVSSPIMQGGELLIAKDGSDVREISRLIIKPIWNAYHFFTLYANADNVVASGEWLESSTRDSRLSTLDSYIITKAMLSVAAIERAMDAYDVPSACKAGAEFFDALNNWYIRRSRDRFWKAQKDADKQAAYDTLYTVLSVMMRALAPLLPLTTEAIYRGLTAQESVHLTAFPYDAFVHAKDMHTDIVASMDKVREVCTAALSIRNNEQMRVRQPLASLTIVHKQADLMKPYADIIADELNVKEVKFVEGVEQYATHKIQPNFAVLGKRLKAEGKEEKMKQIIPAIKKNEYKFLGRGEIEVCGETLRHYDDEYTALLEPKNKQGTMALPAQDGLVVLDLALTPELKTEGYARDIIRMVQQARKDAGLQITDHITLTFKGDAELEAAFTQWQKTIEEQTLSQGSIAEPTNANYKAEEEIEGKKAVVGVKKT